MLPERKTSDEQARQRSIASAQPCEARALVAGSMWLYLGFIGAAAFGSGLILTLDDATNGVLTWAVIAAGGMLAPACWLRAQIIFARAVRELTNKPDADASGARPLRRHVRETIEHAWTDVVDGTRPLQERQPTC